MRESWSLVLRLINCIPPEYPWHKKWILKKHPRSPNETELSAALLQLLQLLRRYHMCRSLFGSLTKISYHWRMPRAFPDFRLVLILLAGLSIALTGYSSAEPQLPFSKKLSVSTFQSNWWSPSEFVIEPEDVEEEVEELKQLDDLFFVSATPDFVFLNSPSFAKINFLSIFSGRLEFLNIPPPYLSQLS